MSKNIIKYQQQKKNINLGVWINDQKKKIKNKENEAYKKMSINKIVKEFLDKYLNREKMRTFDETLEIFLEFINENKRIPTYIEKYKNINIGMWLNKYKMKIKNIVKDDACKKISTNMIAKEGLDEYLNKEKIRTFDETFEIFLEFVNNNKRVPTQIEKYKNIKIGMWLNVQKMKIKNKDEVYKKMSINKIVKECLDNYLNRKKINTFNEILEIFLEYVNENKRIPTQKEKYKNINIGKWLNRQKMKIKNKEDDIYKKMSINKIVKECLDEYLKMKKFCV
jgi:hypothetical protein